MTIQTGHVSNTVPLLNLVRASYSSERVSVPVQRSQYMYANFKHVRGIPANHDGEGFSLMKLKVLDSLLDRLGHFKGNHIKMESATESSLSSDEISSLVKQYGNELQQMVNKIPPSFQHLVPEQGLLVNTLI